MLKDANDNSAANKIDHVLFVLALTAIMAYFVHGVWGKIPFEPKAAMNDNEIIIAATLEKPVVTNSNVIDFLADNDSFSGCSNSQCSLTKSRSR